MRGCIGLARRLNSAHLLTIRNGLATIELRQGNTTPALSSFSGLGETPQTQGLEQESSAAELGRGVPRSARELGRDGETGIRTMRNRLAEGISVEPCDTNSPRALRPGTTNEPDLNSWLTSLDYLDG